MKNRFTSFDLICEIKELQKRLVGLRVNQVYDVDRKTYLIRLQKPEEKVVLLLESGSRFHTTSFDWPKNPAPSGFSMKLRKHINNKRLESITQMGVDRVIDLQFGSEEAAYHVILELYDRGNIVLTDHQYNIMNILRPRVQGEDKFLVRETYPIELVKQDHEQMTMDKLKIMLSNAKPNDTLKKVLLAHFPYGPGVFEHLLLEKSMNANMKVGKDLNLGEHGPKLIALFEDCQSFVNSFENKGYIIQKKEIRPKAEGEDEEFLSYTEFHPFLMKQVENKPFLVFDTFDTAVDEFYSKVESQKIEMKTIQQEKQAFKKLENVKKDHTFRLEKLQQEQKLDRRKAELIEMNEKLVDNALVVMRSAIANQIDWKEIKELVKEATEKGDPVASKITELKLETNHFSMKLSDPYAHFDQSDDSDSQKEDSGDREEVNECVVDIDLDLSAQANARKYYHQKKWAAAKERKTVDSHSVALKSAEKRTKQTLKEVAAIANINKARKVFWFEKFFWFITSENYLVIAGRDMQQNELLVKRYMRPGDVYVHADLHGAASVIIKNPSGLSIPPKTLNEAGQVAICYSVAWENKVITSAWWVEASQVSKTAPSGEYLSAGSFMIRGKKNFLLPATLIMGFGFLFKLEESSLERHKGERKVRVQDDLISIADSEATINTIENEEDTEIAIDENASSDEEEGMAEEGQSLEVKPKLDQIPEDCSDEKDENLEDEISVDMEAKAKLEETSDDENDGEVEVEESLKDEQTIDEDDQDSAFPDTTINLNITKGGKVEMKTKGTSEGSEDREEVVIRFVEKPKAKKQQNASKKGRVNIDAEAEESEKRNKGQNNKRGKKGKLKKIKDKYKDQDDEEKELRMQILQGAQRQKKKDSKNKKRQEENVKKQTNLNKVRGNQHRPRQQPHDEEEDEEKLAKVNTEIDVIDSLTGIPVAEDELLFAIPVVAPYNTMTNYKFKVKLTPGTGKRGKATKTALNMFLVDKSTSQREKDLLKSVKDQDLARNLPGKVKLSAPHLQKMKGKKK